MITQIILLNLFLQILNGCSENVDVCKDTPELIKNKKGGEEEFRRQEEEFRRQEEELTKQEKELTKQEKELTKQEKELTKQEKELKDKKSKIILATYEGNYYNLADWVDKHPGGKFYINDLRNKDIKEQWKKLGVYDWKIKNQKVLDTLNTYIISNNDKVSELKIQEDELKIQEDELKIQKDELKKQKDELKKQKDELTKQEEKYYIDSGKKRNNQVIFKFGELYEEKYYNTYNESNFNKAVDYYIESGKEGNNQAILKLGELYEEKYYITSNQSDFNNAVDYFNKIKSLKDQDQEELEFMSGTCENNESFKECLKRKLDNLYKTSKAASE